MTKDTKKSLVISGTLKIKGACNYLRKFAKQINDHLQSLGVDLKHIRARVTAVHGGAQVRIRIAPRKIQSYASIGIVSEIIDFFDNKHLFLGEVASRVQVRGVPKIKRGTVTSPRAA